MNILYINVIEENSPWGAECFVNKAFNKKNNQVFNLDYRKNRYQLADRFLEIQDDFDVLFLQRGDFFPLSLLKACNRPKFFWASELVSRRKDQDRLFDSGLFNHVFVRGVACREALLSRKILKENQISILLSGFDQENHYKIPGIIKDIDVLFVGSMTPRRKQIVEELKKNFSVTFCQSFGKEMVELFNRAKIVLNLHAEEYLDTETRIFEALGCGAFIITDKLAQENPFVNNVHLVEADSLEDMKTKISYYLQNDTERESVALAGHNEALLKHTYDARAEQIIKTMELCIKSGDEILSPISKEKVLNYKRIEPLANLKFYLINLLIQKLVKIKNFLK